MQLCLRVYGATCRCRSAVRRLPPTWPAWIASAGGRPPARVQPRAGVVRRGRRRHAPGPSRRRRAGERADLRGAVGPAGRVGVRRPERGRPARRPGRGGRRPGCPHARHRPGDVRPGVQPGRQLAAVVRRPPAAVDADLADVRQRSRREWAGYLEYSTAFADALAEQASPGAQVVVQDYHLSLVPAAAARAPSRPADRALQPHAVGAAAVLPDPAGRHRPRGADRAARRRHRRLPVGALGRRVRPLLRGGPRGDVGRLRRAARGPYHPGVGARARRRRRGAAAAGVAAGRAGAARGRARAGGRPPAWSCGSTGPS